jgi:hypothetical protein
MPVPDPQEADEKKLAEIFQSPAAGMRPGRPVRDSLISISKINSQCSLISVVAFA